MWGVKGWYGRTEQGAPEADRITSPEMLLDYVRNREPRYVLTQEEIDSWPVLDTGSIDNLIAEDDDLRIWVSRALAADRESALRKGEHFGTIERRSGRFGQRSWVSEEWVLA